MVKIFDITSNVVCQLRFVVIPRCLKTFIQMFSIQNKNIEFAFSKQSTTKENFCCECRLPMPSLKVQAFKRHSDVNDFLDKGQDSKLSKYWEYICLYSIIICLSSLIFDIFIEKNIRSKLFSYTLTIIIISGT